MRVPVTVSGDVKFTIAPQTRWCCLEKAVLHSMRMHCCPFLQQQSVHPKSHGHITEFHGYITKPHGYITGSHGYITKLHGYITNPMATLPDPMATLPNLKQGLLLSDALVRLVMQAL